MTEHNHRVAAIRPLVSPSLEERFSEVSAKFPVQASKAESALRISAGLA